MTTPDVPERWVEMFGEGWRSVPAGEPGDRRRAGLARVLADLRQQVEELDAFPVEGIVSEGDALFLLRSKVLDLLNEGGSDEG